MALITHSVATWCQDRGTLSVERDDQTRDITRFIVDNSQCEDVVRIQLIFQPNGSVLLDQTYQPFAAVTDVVPPAQVRWTNNSATKESNWDIRVSSWTP